MRKLTKIIVHCSATRPDWMSERRSEEKVAEIRRWHVDGNGWSDIGYNAVIDRDGTVLEARPIHRAGAHARGHNGDSVGICLLGGHGGSASDAFDENFTPEQDRALRRQIAILKAEYPTIEKVIGHNDVTNSKTCPNFKVDAWLKSAEAKKPERTKITQSKTIQASSVAKVASAATPLVGVIGGLPWQNLAIMGALAVVAMIALGVIDLERLAKWRKGDR